MKHRLSSQIVLLLCLFILPFVSCESGFQKDIFVRGASPQAIQVLRDEIVAVTDTAYINGEWGEGRLILVDLESEERIGACGPTPVDRRGELAEAQRAVSRRKWVAAMICCRREEEEAGGLLSHSRGALISGRSGRGHGLACRLRRDVFRGHRHLC